VIQYYRASSVALSLDGYNNTAALSEVGGGEDIPLPSGIHMPLLECMNTTIANEVPLVDESDTPSDFSGMPSGSGYGMGNSSAGSRVNPPFELVGVGYLVWILAAMLT